MRRSKLELSSPLRQNLLRLNLLRSIIVLAILVTGAAVQWGLDVALPLLPLGVVLALIVVQVALTAWRLRRGWPVVELEMLLHLSLDVLGFCALLYFSGGAGNPFVSLFLLPVVIAAITLPGRYALALTALATLGYSLLLVYFIPLVPDEHAHHSPTFGLHVMGMWVNFLVSAGLVLWIVSRMADALRDRDRQLARVRERSMRDDKVVSLGLLAAGAAHELATPISTMSVLLGEMAISARHDPAMKEDLAMLESQVMHCRNVIKGLAASAGQAHSAQLRRLDLAAFVDETIDRWRLLRPAVPCTTVYDVASQRPTIVADETLSSTLTSLLNNAADASPEGIELTTRCDHNEVTLEILDHGPGISDEVLRHAGRAIVTTKPAGKGWGIGLFLANATVERLGGSIILMRRPEGGNCTRIQLPLLSLQGGTT